MNNKILTLLSRARLVEEYASGRWGDDTIFSLVARHALDDPERVAIRSRSATMTYRTLVEHATALGADLLASGVKPGDRLAVWAPSRIEIAVALVACSRGGHICCPSLHRDHTVADVVELCNRMRASALLWEIGYGADSHRRDVMQELTAVRTLRRTYTLEPSNSPLIAALAQVAASEEAPTKLDPNQVVYLAFTSGTTDRPKGVMHSDNTLLANARALIKDWSFGRGSVIYTMSPLSHNLGLGSLVMALASGGELVVHDLARGASLLDRLGEVKATFLVGVPTHAIDLLTELRSRRISAPPTLKGFRISGASAPREVVAELLQHGVIPQSGYGMTEAGSHHYTLPTDREDRIIDTSGRACDGYEVRIWSKEDADLEVPIGEVGQIGGRGASLMLGYFDDQAANDDAFNSSGWFMTGDLGRLDEHGYLQITGRKKDLIIRGGHNIFPAKIENLAMQHVDVARAAALPIADPRLGEKVCLVVMPRPGRQLSPQELLVHLDESGLSHYDMPEYYIEVSEIPLTASGKILKRELASQLLDGRLKPTPVRWTPARPEG